MSREELKLKIAARIRQLRKRKGFSSAEKFANEHEFSRAAYGKYETGKKGFNIELHTLIKICNCLGVTLREFFSENID